MYLFDKTTFTDQELAFIRASEVNLNKEALATLGYFHGLGMHGFTKNKQKAINLLTQAMSGKYAQAFYLYAKLVEDPNFDKIVDYTKAIAFYKRSAELGFSPAMVGLGECYLYGRGIIKSLRDAEKWLINSRLKEAIPALKILIKEYSTLELFDKVKNVEAKIDLLTQQN